MSRTLDKLALFVRSSNTLQKAWQDARNNHDPSAYESLRHDQGTFINHLLTHFFPPAAGFAIWPAGTHTKPLPIKLTMTRKKRTIPVDHTFIFEIQRLRPAPPEVDADIDDHFIHHASVLIISAPPQLRSRWALAENAALAALREMMVQQGVERGPVILLHADGLEVWQFDEDVEALRPFVLPGEKEAASVRIAPGNLARLEEIMRAFRDAEVRHLDGAVWKVREETSRKVMKGRPTPRDPLQTWKGEGRKRKRREEVEVVVERPVEGPLLTPEIEGMLRALKRWKRQ